MLVSDVMMREPKDDDPDVLAASSRSCIPELLPSLGDVSEKNGRVPAVPAMTWVGVSMADSIVLLERRPPARREGGAMLVFCLCR